MKKVFKILFLAMFFVFALLQFSPAKAEEFFGIGAELAQDTFSKKVIVVNVMDNKPAQRLGVKAGDEIIAVDNEKVKKLTLCDVISKIRGPENSAVKIRIKKNFFVRKTICQPVLPKNSRQEIIDYEQKQASRKGLLGAWSKFYRKITGKKSLTEKTKIENKNVK